MKKSDFLQQKVFKVKSWSLKPVGGRSGRREGISLLAGFLIIAAWLGLPAMAAAASTTVTRGPYLQQATPVSLMVRWRTAAATDSWVRFGNNAATLTLAADDPAVTTEHIVTLTGLTPNTQYFYSVGSTAETIAGDASYTFFTPPTVGTRQPTRIWVLGDSGTADADAAAVRNAYTTFNDLNPLHLIGPLGAARYTDAFLMLGDNAYATGTDSEYQAAVYNMYPTLLRQTALWPTIGNHDTAGSYNPPDTIPYFNMFSLPTSAEAGGTASGTEKYYSFDRANIHFVCLDSMTSNRLAGSPMLLWLQNDLVSTTADWIIAYWHHPPYTKGSHDSDTEFELIEMRQNALPILEAGGVDLVLSGHSHSYERSVLLNGHYGVSTTLTAAMKLNSGSGREDGTGSYLKPEGGPSGNQGVVYAVAGSGGQGPSGGTLNHPVMFKSLNLLGSMVLDVVGDRLDAKFIQSTGVIGDYFTMLKNVPNLPPVVQITSPVNAATYLAGVNIPVTATATDPVGQVIQVDFYAGNTLIGSDTTAPYSISWNQVPVGNYTLTAAATDNLGATAVSAPVQISVGAAIKAVADAYVRDGNDANRNFGTNRTLLVQTNVVSKNYSSFMKFDTTSIPAVGSARLRIYGKYSKTPAATITGYGVNNLWTETGITWNNRPALGPALGSMVMTSTETWREIDVTVYVQAQKTAGQNVVSFGLLAPATLASTVQIKSRENGSTGPELLIAP